MFEENEETLAPEPELQESDVVFPTLNHRWRARGQEVYCISCGSPHGFTLEIGTKLVGESNGAPIFEKVFDISAEAHASTELSSSGDDKSL